MKTSKLLRLFVIKGSMAAALMLACSIAFAGPPPRFHLTDLSAVTGGRPGGWANAINDHGDVVGWVPGANGYLRPFLYRNGTLTELGSGSTWGEAVAINNAGQIVVRDAGTSFLISGDTAVDLSAQSGQRLEATSVNDSGVVVGGSQSTAFSWSSGVFTLLEMPANALTSTALDINSGGVIAGVSTIPTTYFGYHSFRAVQYINGQGSVLALPAGALGSTGRAVNDLGQVVGEAYYVESAPLKVHPFLFKDGESIDIGVPPGHALGYAFDINNAGQVVGNSVDRRNELHAFIYSMGELHNLNQVMKHARGWHFRTAKGINNHGQIVGEALFEGESRPYILTPIPSGKD